MKLFAAAGGRGLAGGIRFSGFRLPIGSILVNTIAQGCLEGTAFKMT